MSTQPQPQQPKHPGTILYVNEAGDVQVRPVASVPEALRFAPTERGLVPVVKVVVAPLPQGDRRAIREYGPDGELLRSTFQARKPH